MRAIDGLYTLSPINVILNNHKCNKKSTINVIPTINVIIINHRCNKLLTINVINFKHKCNKYRKSYESEFVSLFKIWEQVMLKRFLTFQEPFWLQELQFVRINVMLGLMTNEAFSIKKWL